jgi:hypothetical protein
MTLMTWRGRVWLAARRSLRRPYPVGARTGEPLP